MYRFQIVQNTNQIKILDPLKINPNDSNQHFLYRGIRTLVTIPVFLTLALVSPSVNNEFGPGLYRIPNLILLLSIQEENGAILVFDWPNLDGDFTIKILTDRDGKILSKVGYVWTMIVAQVHPT